MNCFVLLTIDLLILAKAAIGSGKGKKLAVFWQTNELKGLLMKAIKSY
jgi:hypothetical protein